MDDISEAAQVAPVPLFGTRVRLKRAPRPGRDAQTLITVTAGEPGPGPEESV